VVEEGFTLRLKPVGTRADTAVGQLGPMRTREKLDPCPIPTAVFFGGLMPCKALGHRRLGKQPSLWLLCGGPLIFVMPSPLGLSPKLPPMRKIIPFIISGDKICLVSG